MRALEKQDEIKTALGSHYSLSKVCTQLSVTNALNKVCFIDFHVRLLENDGTFKSTET